LSDSKHRYVRIADDFVVMCRTKDGAEAVLTDIQRCVAQHELALHPEKTLVGNCMEKGQGFDFLGYRFEAGRRWACPKSRKALRDKIRQLLGRTRSGSMDSIVYELIPVLRDFATRSLVL